MTLTPCFRHNKTHRRTLSLFSLDVQAFIWLGVPMILFLGGWMKWYISVPLCIILILASIHALRMLSSTTNTAHPCIEQRNVRRIFIVVDRTYIISLVGIFAILILMGHGAFMYQHYDFYYRNAVMFDLSTQEWPVIYDSSTPRLLCYYFAYWLPASLVAKMTGYILPGDIALLVWGFWGTAIGFSYLVSFMGGKTKWWFIPSLLMIGFADWIFINFFGDSLSSLLGLRYYGFESFYASFNFLQQLLMIFNQTIPLWIGLPLLYRLRTQPGIILLPASLLFIFAPLPCVGISLAIAFVLIKGGRSSLTLTNAAGLISIAVTGLFYMTNNNASTLDKNTMTETTQIIIIGIIFFISAIGIYLPFVWKQASRNIIFIIILTTGMLLPLLAMGNSDDLGRRSLIPTTIMLTYMIIRRLGEMKSMKRLQAILFSVALLAGTHASVKAICEHYKHNCDLMPDRGLIVKKIDLMGRLDSRKFNYCYDNFIAEGDSFYTRYMMKK